MSTDTTSVNIVVLYVRKEYLKTIVRIWDGYNQPTGMLQANRTASKMAVANVSNGGPGGFRLGKGT